jgi:hypothetical protein
MADTWAEAQDNLVGALQRARNAGVSESEAMSALDDVYNEDDVLYEVKE